jgi:hypothetical protein
LFGEEESLHEFTPRVTMVRHLSDDLDDDTTVCGGLRINGVDEDFAVLESDGGDLIVNFLCITNLLERVMLCSKYNVLPHLLTVAWLAILTLSAMDEGGRFSVKTMQTIWLLIDESIVLGNKLPSDLRRNDVVMNSGRVSVRIVGHDEEMMLWGTGGGKQTELCL